jgi:hypothetical protein
MGVAAGLISMIVGEWFCATWPLERKKKPGSVNGRAA